DVDVGNDVLRLRGVVTAAGLGVEVLDDLDVFLEVIDRDAELACNLWNLVVLQELQVFGDHALRGRSLEPDVTELEQQALLQIPRGNTRRVESLNQSEGALDLGHGPGPHTRQLVERCDQVPIIVKV